MASRVLRSGGAWVAAACTKRADAVLHGDVLAGGVACSQDLLWCLTCDVLLTAACLSQYRRGRMRVLLTRTL